MAWHKTNNRTISRAFRSAVDRIDDTAATIATLSLSVPREGLQRIILLHRTRARAYSVKGFNGRARTAVACDKWQSMFADDNGAHNYVGSPLCLSLVRLQLNYIYDRHVGITGRDQCARRRWRVCVCSAMVESAEKWRKPKRYQTQHYSVTLRTNDRQIVEQNRKTVRSIHVWLIYGEYGLYLWHESDGNGNDRYKKILLSYLCLPKW